MAKINENNNKFRWIYIVGFFITLALPLLNLPPWFDPPDWGKTIVFRSILAILFFLFIWQFLYRRNQISLPNIKNNEIIWALISLFTVFLLACIFSVDPHFSFWGSPYRGGGFITFAFYFLFALLSFILFKKEDWKKAWILSIFIGILVSLIAIIQFYGLLNNIFISVGSRPGSTIGNPIFLGIYLLLLFLPTLSFFIKEKTPWLKIFFGGSLLLFLYVIIITGSRSAYLGIAMGLLYFFLFYPKKFKAIKILATAFILFVGLTILYISIQTHFPQTFEQNRIFTILHQRLSIKFAFSDE
ncbi:MAG: O-antigen ligase family protein, partial [Candidatus Staskawiczbacteria bacterium]|nr:O-antigen ligase family protein [Candidatus Staskawiczbacteria bacterium]